VKNFKFFTFFGPVTLGNSNNIKMVQNRQKADQNFLNSFFAHLKQKFSFFEEFFQL
jgi:hypothetical protein